MLGGRAGGLNDSSGRSYWPRQFDYESAPPVGPGAVRTDVAAVQLDTGARDGKTQAKTAEPAVGRQLLEREEDAF